MVSLNQVTLIGHLGGDPQIKTMTDGRKLANLSVATSEAWKDKATGERRERTEWHRVTIFGPLAEVAEKILRKGSKVYLSGNLRTRKWQDKEGRDRYTTEIVLQGWDAKLIALDRRSDGGGAAHPHSPSAAPDDVAPVEEIPF